MMNWLKNKLNKQVTINKYFYYLLLLNVYLNAASAVYRAF